MAVNDQKVRVLVAGPGGRMGGAMMKGLPDEDGIEVIGGLRRDDPRRDELLAAADVLVDFTHVESAVPLMLEVIEAGVRPVSGTSGLSEDGLRRVDEAARARGIGALWASNFNYGGVLMAHVSEIIARFLTSVEIIEMHHTGKADAPSGTALELARRIRKVHGGDLDDPPVARTTLPGVRGGVEGGVHIHSVRLPGLLSKHNIVFSGDQSLMTIDYEEFGRAGFVHLVGLAAHEVMRPDAVGLIRGLDSVVGLAPPSSGS